MFKRLELSRNSLEQNNRLYPKIFMRQNVSHPDHFMPRNIRMSFLQCIRHSGRRLAKMNHVYFDLLLEPTRCKIRRLIHAIKNFTAAPDKTKHVFDSLGITDHTATISLLTSRAKRCSVFITSESITSTLRPKNRESESCIRT